MGALHWKHFPEISLSSLCKVTFSQQNRLEIKKNFLKSAGSEMAPMAQHFHLFYFILFFFFFFFDLIFPLRHFQKEDSGS